MGKCEMTPSEALVETMRAEGVEVCFGLVVGVHIDDEAIVDGRIASARLKPIARLGYMDYAVVEQVFAMQRPDA